MKPGMFRIAALSLSALTVGAAALPMMAWAQGGGKRQGRNAVVSARDAMRIGIKGHWRGGLQKRPCKI